MRAAGYCAATCGACTPSSTGGSAFSAAAASDSSSNNKSSPAPNSLGQQGLPATYKPGKGSSTAAAGSQAMSQLPAGIDASVGYYVAPAGEGSFTGAASNGAGLRAVADPYGPPAVAPAVNELEERPTDASGAAGVSAGLPPDTPGPQLDRLQQLLAQGAAAPAATATANGTGAGDGVVSGAGAPPAEVEPAAPAALKPLCSQLCNDTPPAGSSLRCIDMRDWNRCGEAWVADSGLCAATCGRCKALDPCTDVAPPFPPYGCAAVRDAYACTDPFLLAGGWCRRTCGHCAPPSEAELEAAGCRPGGPAAALGGSPAAPAGPPGGAAQQPGSTAGCRDVPPPGIIPCSVHQQLGNCNKDILRAANYCAKTCGACR